MSELSGRSVVMTALCRFCLARKRDLQPIFDGSAALLRKIGDIIQLEVTHDDGLPTSICQQCLFQLNTAHCFKQRCISSENRLRAYLAQVTDPGFESLLDLFPPDAMDPDTDHDSDHDYDLPLCEVVYTEPLGGGGGGGGDMDHKPVVGVDVRVKRELADQGGDYGADARRARAENKRNADESESEDDAAAKSECDERDASADDDRGRVVENKIRLKKLIAAQKKKDSKNIPVICEICGKLFKKNHLYYHRKLHDSERKFECTTCNKSFKMQSHLKRHVRLHKGEKSFLCSFCGKSFIDSSNLRNHVRNHRQERNHACVTCGKAFARAETLTKHLRSHTGEKPYTCEVCQRLFPRKDSLIRHMKSHRGERPHKCEVCDRSFTQSYDLKLHLRKHAARAI